jgi:Protein of unknown function (DUF2963).
MSKKLAFLAPKLAFLATFGLALAFTYSCSNDDGNNNGGSEQKCGGVGYDPSVYRCESGELVGKCKGEDYYPAYQQCVGGAIVDGVPSSSSKGDGSNPGGSYPPGSGPKGAISKRAETYFFYNSDGSVSSTGTDMRTYEYYSNDNLKKEIHYIDNSNDVDYSYEYEYDNRGNQIKRTERKADESIDGIYEYEYDSKGNQIKRISLKPDGSINRTYIYEYDTKGNQIKSTTLDASNALRATYEATYDGNNNITREIGKDATGTIRERTEYTWNSDGKNVTYTKYDDEEISYTVEAIYITISSEKLRTSYIRNNYENGSISDKEKREYQYDSKGNRTKSTEFNWNKVTNSWVKSYEYTYTYTYIN